MSATPTISELDTAIHPLWRTNAASRLNVAIGLSAIAHAALLLGVAVRVPLAGMETAGPPLEVLLVGNDAVSSSEPSAPPAVKAAPNIDLGEKSPSLKNRSSKAVPMPGPARSEDTMVARAPTPERTAEPESPEPETEQAAPVESPPDRAIPQADTPFSQAEPDWNNSPGGTMGLVQRGLEIARLQAQTVQNVAYQQAPRRKFIGNRTQDYRFARYVEDWRLKVERIGNLNYPEAAKRDHLYGSLRLTVGIRSDGSLESIDINRASGKKVLDEAAIRIVKLAGQNGFAPFPADIGREIDILHITRTWVFTRADELTSE